MNVTDKAKIMAMTKVFDYVGKAPESNIPKVMELMDKVFKPEEFKPQRDMIREILNDPDNCWYKYIIPTCKQLVKVV